MAKKPVRSTKSTGLRQQAEALLLASKREIAAMPVKDVQQLVHELQVHQIELDMQNDELRRTQVELEAVRDRYVDLYDFSPVSYLTLDMRGAIVECNLRAATALDANRKQLIGQPFARFVASCDRDIFHRHCHDVVKAGTMQTCEVRIQKKGGVPRLMQLESIAFSEEMKGTTHWRTVLHDITEHKQAETKLKAAQDKFENIFESSRDAIGYAALDGAILLINQAFLKLTGFSREELLRMNTRDLIPEQHKERRARIVAQVLQTGESAEYDIDYLRKNGSRVPVSITLFAVKGNDGKPTGLAAIVRNLTEHKQAEEQFRLVVESSPNGMLMVDGNGTILLVNRQIEQQFGYERAELIGMPVEMLVPQRIKSHHASDRAAFFAHFESRAMGKGRDLYGVRKDGQEFPLEIGLNPIQTSDRMRVLAAVVDISERKRAEQTLQKERDFIDAVLETAGALVVVLDRSGRIQRFNRACEQTTGYSSEEVMGRYAWDLFVIPDEVEAVKSVFERLRGGEPRNDYENYWKGKDGSLRRISWSNTVLTDSNGMVDYVVAAGLDITDLTQIQEQLRNTERIAELGTLASGMAHEIGTPMNVILGRAEYLLKRTADEGMKKGLATIVTQIERITKVMNQLLAFARRRTPERRPVDLSEIVEDSLEMFQERIARHRITVEKAIEAGLPPVHADRDQLIQVLINLVVNSLHAMTDGGRLRLSLAREKSHILIGVSDTGHGMPQDICSKVFDPFFTTKDFGKGTGLGLTVVKGIIEEHGGTIVVESVVGQGTTFWIRLPLDSAEGAATSLPTPTPSF